MDFKARPPITLTEIKAKTGRDKDVRLQRIAKLCNTDGNYNKNRKKPRHPAEQRILDRFKEEGYK